MTAPVAIGSVFIECNHFGGVLADLMTFRRSDLLFGDEMLQVANGVVGGMLDVLRRARRPLTPLLMASACPSGPVMVPCYEELKEEMLSRLRAALPVGGLLLGLHGAAAAENVGDIEGDLLESARQIVGPQIPIVATLDLHAHVTESMVREADALLAWETYPHRDAFETGQRGAQALLEILSGVLVPTMAMAKVPVLVSGIHGNTDPPGPFAEVMQAAKRFEESGSAYSANAILVHPYLDLPDMGGGGLVITNGDMPRAVEIATGLAKDYWDRRFDLEPTLCHPEAAIESGLKVPGMILLVETADCCGGGAAGDSVQTVRALLAAKLDEPSIAPIVDPVAARACHEAGAESRISLSIGHGIDAKWGEPLRVSGQVEAVTDGRFRYKGGIWDGRLGEMGLAAVLRVGEVRLCIASHPTYEWCGEQMASLNVDTSSAKFIVAKNPMNYGLAYPKARAAYVLDTPGPTPATLRHLRFSAMKRPYFPLDESIPGLKPLVFRGRHGDWR